MQPGRTPSAPRRGLEQPVPSRLRTMIEILRWLGILIRAAVRERRDLALENLAIRQQLGVLKRRKGVPRLRRKDRLFWVVLSRIWAPWRRALHLVNADTVVGWQQKGFRIYWARVSQRKSGGRPPASSELRALIQRMAVANPYWGAPRLHGELLNLGIAISRAANSPGFSGRHRTPLPDPRSRKQVRGRSHRDA
jgi:putative transposase